MSEIRSWDNNLPYFIEHWPYDCEYRIMHQGWAVKVSEFEVAKEESIYHFYPKYYVATDAEKREMLAKALWTRLQKLGEQSNEKSE